MRLPVAFVTTLALLSCTPNEDAAADDVDGDGWTVSDGDCDDDDSAVHPDAEDAPYDGVDANCDDASDNDADGDGDDDADHGGSDCDDEDPEAYDDADEICNGVDDDCDGRVDDDDTLASGSGAESWYEDADDDGYGDPGERETACEAPNGYVDDRTDCDDAVATVHPNAKDVLCDGLDNDCDDRSFEAGGVRIGSTTYDDIAAAIAAATPSDTIELCEGRYVEHDLDLGGASLRGLGGSALTRIDAAGLGSVLGMSVGAATLEGVTLTGGDTPYPGSGLWIGPGAAATLVDVVVVDNEAEVDGGGLWIGASADVTFLGVEIGGNATQTMGGGLYAEAFATLTASDLDIHDNTAPGGGGGACLEYGVSFDGGESTTIRRNEAIDPGTGLMEFGVGGGIAAFDIAVLSGIDVEDNTAEGAGGLVLGAGSLSHARIDGNEATVGFGGGMSVGGQGDVSLLDVTVSANNAMTGGGIDFDSTLTVTDCTITNNDAIPYMGTGGGVFAYGASGEQIVSVNTNWGSGSTDNEPADLEYFDTDKTWSWSGNATFTCNPYDCVQ